MNSTRANIEGPAKNQGDGKTAEQPKTTRRVAQSGNSRTGKTVTATWMISHPATA